MHQPLAHLRQRSPAKLRSLKTRCTNGMLHQKKIGTHAAMSYHSLRVISLCVTQRIQTNCRHPLLSNPSAGKVSWIFIRYWQTEWTGIESWLKSSRMMNVTVQMICWEMFASFRRSTLQACADWKLQTTMSRRCWRRHRCKLGIPPSDVFRSPKIS